MSEIETRSSLDDSFEPFSRQIGNFHLSCEQCNGGYSVRIQDLRTPINAQRLISRDFDFTLCVDVSMLQQILATLEVTMQSNQDNFDGIRRLLERYAETHGFRRDIESSLKWSFQ